MAEHQSNELTLANAFHAVIGNVHFSMQSQPDYSHNGVNVWGYVYKGLEILLSGEWSKEKLLGVNGYYFAIKECDDAISITNDITGGYRCYYVMKDDILYVSDRYVTLFDTVLGGKATLNEGMYEYWKKHRYTLDDDTLFKDLHKFSPAALVSFHHGGLYVDTYFPDCMRTPNYKKIVYGIHNDVKEQLMSIYHQERDKKFVVFYSGGADSTYLLLTMRELKIPFQCVTIRYIPRWSLNEPEVAKAIMNMENLGINDYEVIDVNLNDALKQYGDIVTDELLFDRHTAVHFYATYSKIVEQFGKDIVIINGQSADSVLSFGPSVKRKSDLVKRILLYSHSWMARWYDIPIKCVSKRYRMPRNSEEKYEAFLDDNNYFFLVDTKCPYKNVLEKVHKDRRILNLANHESKCLYLKTIGFLQGPDNQVVLKSARHFGIKSIVMPFVAPSVMMRVAQYKNNAREIVNPKYAVRDILKRVYGYNPVDVAYKKGVKDDFDYNSYNAKVLDLFCVKIKSLTHD